MSDLPVKKKRNYSEDFKKEAVATYEASGKSKAEICRLLDISCGGLLRKWCVVYSTQKTPSSKGQSLQSKNTSSEGTVSSQKSSDSAKIAYLEEEVKRLRQILGNHAAKDYLAELREESWRELSPQSTLKDVDRLVAKKL